MSRLAKDIVTFVIIAGGSVFLYVKSLDFPQGANIFPHFLVIAIFGLSLIMFGQTLLPIVRSRVIRNRESSQNNEPSLQTAVQHIAAEEQLQPEEKRSWTPYLLTAGGILYLVAITTIGFFVSSVVFLTLGMYLFGIRRIWIMVLSEGVLLLFIYLVFVRELHVALPTGLLV